MKDDRREKNKKWISIFIIAVMVLSTLGVVIFGFSDSTQSIDYNGVSFRQLSQGWEAKIGGINYRFNFHPLELESLNVSSGIIGLIKEAEITGVTYDPDSAMKQEMALAQYTLVSALQQANKPAVSGFTKETQYDVPVFDCVNSSMKSPVIVMFEGNSTGISAQDGCILVEGSGEGDFIAFSERLQYGFLGVMG